MRYLIKSLLLFLNLSLLSCGSGGASGGSSGGGAAATVEGANYSGTYNLVGVECYTTSGARSVYATFTASASEKMIISGNSMINSVTDSNCVGSKNYKMVITPTTTSYGTYNLTNGTSSTTTAANCSFTESLTNVTGGSLNATSFTFSVR